MHAHHWTGTSVHKLCLHFQHPTVINTESKLFLSHIISPHQTVQSFKLGPFMLEAPHSVFHNATATGHVT